jgi:hypothetical protein
MAKLCCDWEQSAVLPADHPSRHVTLRIGLVLGRDGGTIKSMIWPFWFGVGGKKSNALIYFNLDKNLNESI